MDEKVSCGAGSASRCYNDRSALCCSVPPWHKLCDGVCPFGADFFVVRTGREDEFSLLGCADTFLACPLRSVRKVRQKWQLQNSISPEQRRKEFLGAMRTESPSMEAGTVEGICGTKKGGWMMRQNNMAVWRAGEQKSYKGGAFHVFRDRRAVVVAGMLLALHLVLAMFLGIYLTQSVKLSVAFITNVVTGYLFGPWMAFVTGALGDILQYILKPVGGYFFGWTLNAAIGGLVYGLAFYRRAPKEKEGTALGGKAPAKEGAAWGQKTPAKRAAFVLSDFVSGGIFAVMLACFAMLPFLAAPARQYPVANLAKLLANPDGTGLSLPQEAVSVKEGSALAFLTGRAGECAETSPHTLAVVSLVLILAGTVFLVCRYRLPVVVLSAAACLWLLLPAYTDRKVLTVKSGFVLICAGFAACALINLMAVLRAKAMDAGFLLRCFVAMLFVAVIVQMFLGTVWCTVMYGKGFWFYFVPRAIKSLIQLPFNALLAYYVIRATHRLRIEA